MKKYYILLASLVLAVIGLAQLGEAQSSPSITVTEIDGSPRVVGVSKIVVSNGTLTASGKTATISTGGGGGGGSVNVNGASVSSPNFNGTTPAAPAGGVNMLYQVSGSDVSNYLDIGAMAIPLIREPRIETDFISSSFGDFSSNGAIAGGTSGVPGGTVSPNHPGVRVFTSSTSANSGFWFYSNQDSLTFGGGERLDIVFLTPSSFTNVTARFGFHDTNGAFDSNDGAYFQYSGSGDVVGKTASAAARTTSSTIATLAADTWYHGVILVNSSATSISFSIYSEAGSLLGTQSNTTNIPAPPRVFGAGANAFSAGTTAVPLIYIDLIAISWTKALTRGQ